MPRTRFRTDATPLSRQEIVEAALVHLDRGDLGSMSIRRLAADLDVAPMSLYRHVRNKDDLLLAVMDVLLDRLPQPTTTDPAAYLEASACALRELLSSEPALLGVFHRQPVTSPAARARLERTVAVLTAGGLTAEQAVHAYAAVHTYTLGFSSLEVGRRAHGDSLPEPEDDTSRAIQSFVTEPQFLVGLRAMVVGVLGR